jgi:hypothetical protein
METNQAEKSRSSMPRLKQRAMRYLVADDDNVLGTGVWSKPFDGGKRYDKLILQDTSG